MRGVLQVEYSHVFTAQKVIDLKGCVPVRQRGKEDHENVECMVLFKIRIRSGRKFCTESLWIQQFRVLSCKRWALFKTQPVYLRIIHYLRVAEFTSKFLTMQQEIYYVKQVPFLAEDNVLLARTDPFIYIIFQPKFTRLPAPSLQKTCM